MKYGILLDDKEVTEILNLNLPLGGRLKWFLDKYSFDEIETNLKVKFIFTLIQGDPMSGNIENNDPNLKCPNCDGKYVVRTYAGDFSYRLYNGTKSQKEKERNKLDKMGLHCNPWATRDESTRDYLCMNCGIRWNGKKDKIYRGI